MSTMDPTGDGGGGGGGTSTTSIDDNATPITPSTGMTMPPGPHHQQHPPPSPLSGCYLLVVLPEPHTAQHRDLILNRLAKGFLSWDKDSCHVDLEKELLALVAQAPEGEEARNGERLIQYATENLVTEVLIHPQTNTLLQCIRNLLASFTKHRHIIHAGYTFGGNGSWILQDGTFSLADFLDAFSEHEVQRVLRAYENSVTVDVNCAGVGDWSTSRLTKEACTRSCRVRLNPDDVLTAGVSAIASFTNYIGQYLVAQTLDQLMEPSDVVGNIRFSHPTLYVFPGGQGDAALFGINGFNMLVDGGFARKACFWDFARHLDRLDAVLVTRINNSNVGGMSSVLRKKRETHVYPQIGHFFCNLVERRHSNSPDGDKDLDPLILNLTDIGQEMMINLRQINLRAHPCYRDPNPINLYHKVGHGTLDMYVLSPSKDSREVRDFLTKWHASDSKLFAGTHKKDSNILTFPIQNLASICALLVWQPANPEDTITRILFPGSTPQHKIFEGFERLKHLDFLKHPVCSAKSLSPSTSLLTLKDRPTIKQKLGLMEKDTKKPEARKEKRDLPESRLSKVADELTSKSSPQSSPIIPIPKSQPAKVDVKSRKVVENKKIETENRESKKIERDLKEIRRDPIKKDVSKIEKDSETKKADGAKIKIDGERPKESKPKPEQKKKEPRESKPVKISKPETPQKPMAKISEKRPKSTAEKKDTAKASPPTPKKGMNGSATKVELAKSTPKPITRPAPKQPISTMPAKSAKDANNRKVVEQKNIEIASAASAAVPAAAKVPAKPKTVERKPISRRAKPVSPSKARIPGSPAKSTRSTPTTSVKSDKDGVIRKVKGDRGTTDSSTVSTPSGIEIDSMTKLVDKSLTEKSEDMSLDSIESKVLADLKEEREVVEEIEAVLQKAERIEEARKDDHLDGDDDVTAEATDKKEDDMTEDDVTADIEEVLKKGSSRKASQELTEEDEYLIVEKEEIYIEDSAQSGEGEQKHVLDAGESEKAKKLKDIDSTKEEDEEEEEEEEEEEAEISEEKEKSDIPEKKLGSEQETDKEKEADDMSTGHKDQLQQEMKDIIASATEMVQKTEDKDDSGKKDSEDITKEPSSLSPDKFDSSEKKTTDTDMKPEVDQKDQQAPEKMEESQERISTLESGATTTAPTLPEDERIPLDDIKEAIDEKFVAEEDKEKDSAEPVKESFVAPLPAEPKPEPKPFEVRPPLQGVQREIVKTPDEVADLPVHEEVDPKLYRMDDFEKAKAAQSTTQQQETKEPPTPPVKEQKGVFSFFGKVADKFEKGMDKLTGKSRRDSEKDIDEKTSSKSSSPKEAKPQEMTFPAEAEEAKQVVAKVDKSPETPDAFEKGEQEASKVKVAAIKETAAFLQGEIEELKKSAHLEQETEEIRDTAGVPESLEPIFETCVLKPDTDKLTSAMADSQAEVEDDAEDVEALLEEASKKFKTVKDSLRDSLESLEDKIVEEEMGRAEMSTASKDVVKDTLSGVVEKLEVIKPQIDDIKEEEKVKFVIPKADDLDDEDEDSTGVTKDFKEAVRDVAEVLAGSAGILIEEKPKDVVEIVKKVAEVLKKDDFLSHDVLFDKDATETSAAEEKPTKPIIEGIILPKKVGVTVELPPQEEVDEMLMGGISQPLTSYAAAGDLEIEEVPCVKTIKPKGIDVMSPSKDPTEDKTDAMKLCMDLMREEMENILSPSRQKRSLPDEDQAQPDVMQAGIESVCVKHEVKHQVSEEEPREIQDSDIVFDRKVSPARAEIVMMTPDSTPTSPKFPMDKIHDKELQAALQEVDEDSELLTADIKNALEKEGPIEKIIEDLVFTNKTKITIEIVEYITVIRKIPRERVIYIVEEIIIKKGVPRETVVADLDLLRPDSVSSDKRSEIELFIDQEYITKNKRITIDIVEEISIKKYVTKRIVIEIIEEIIVKRKIPRDKVMDISDKVLSELGLQRKESMAGQDDSAPAEFPVDKDDADDEAQEIDSTTADKTSEIENYIVAEIISKGNKITPQLIDDVCVAKRIPRRVFVEIIEEIIIRRKIPRSSILDISEKELSELLASEKEDTEKDELASEPEKEEEETDVDAVSPEKRLQVEQSIVEEYVTKNRRITPYAFEEICGRNGMPRRVIIEIIEEIIVKRKIPRSSVIDISDNELEELLAADEDESDKESVAPVSEKEDEEREDEQIPEAKSDKAEKITPDNRSEIENSIVEEFVSTGKRITPYIFEDICVRYKVPRRVIVGIIEEIVINKKIRRSSLLDITETELTELLAAVEAEGDEDDEIDVASTEKKDSAAEHVEEDKLVDGFVSIPSKDDIPKTGLTITSKSIELAESALKESEKDVDDFEAVEQEYKIHSSIALSKDVPSVVSAAKLDEKKIKDEIDEAIEDDTSEVVEAEEKIIGATSTAVPESPTEKKSEKSPDASEIVDTTEKYLIEAQEKTEHGKDGAEQSWDENAHTISGQKQLSPQEEIVDRKHSLVHAEHSYVGEQMLAEASAAPTLELKETDAAKEVGKMPATSLGDDTTDAKKAIGTGAEGESIVDARKSSIAEIKEQPKESTEQESKVHSPIPEDKAEVSRAKRSIEESPADRKFSIQELDATALKSGAVSPNEEKSSIGIDVDDSPTVPAVRRMVVTASSEDGGHETEVCPTGSITFKKAVTPDDSLKSSPIKTTPDQDSLQEKELVRSGASTPEKDSISGKSTPGTKDGDKITPDDSLDKSPSVARDSQDLEDSLDKSDLTKLKDTEKPKAVAEEDEEAIKKTPEEIVQPVVKDESHFVTDSDEKKSTGIPSPMHAGQEDKKVHSAIVPSAPDMDDEEEPLDKAPSLIVGEKVKQEEDLRPETPRSRASSTVSEKAVPEHAVSSSPGKLDEDETKDVTAGDRSKSPSITGKDDEIQSLAGTKSPTPSIDEKEVDGLSKRSSLAGDKIPEMSHEAAPVTISLGEAETISASRLDEKEKPTMSADKTKSPTPEPDTIEGLKTLDRSRSASVVSDKSSIADGIQEPGDSSKPASIVDGTDFGEDVNDEAGITEHLKSISAASDTIGEKDAKLSDRDAKLPIATSPSDVDDQYSIKDIAELDGKEPSDRSRSASIIGDAPSETDSKEPLAKSRTPSLVTDRVDKETPADRSKSPSITSDKHSEKDIADLDDKEAGRSKSPSIAADTPTVKDLKEPSDKSRSSSIAGEKHDDKAEFDHAKPSSVSSEKHSEKDIAELDHEEPVLRSREPSIAGDTKLEKAASTDASAGKHDERQPLDRSRSPSIAGDKLSEKDTKEPADKSRSASLIGEKVEDMPAADHSKSPSVASEKYSEKDIAELDDEELIGRSRQSSISDAKSEKSATPGKPALEKQPLDRSLAGGKPGDEDFTEPSEKSRASSLIAETIDLKAPVEHSKSPSIASEKLSEKDITEVDEEAEKEEELQHRSRGPSITTDKLDERDIKDQHEKSRSPSIVGEKFDDKAIAHSKSPSIASEKHSETDMTELEDEEPVGRSREPSIVSVGKLGKMDAPSKPAEVHAEKQPMDRSRSSSIAHDMSSEKDSIVPADKSRSPSIAHDHIEEKAPIDRSRSSSIAGSRLSEIDPIAPADKSRSPSIAHDQIEEKAPIDRSRSSSIAGNRLSDMDTISPADKSRSPSISSEKPDEKASVDRSRSPSIVAEDLSRKSSALPAVKPSGKDPITTSEEPRDKDTITPTDKSRSPSIASDKLSEKDSIIPADKSRSPSIASDKPDEKTLIERSKSPSIAGDKHSEKDITEVDDEEPVDRSKSPSIATDKSGEKDSIIPADKSRSPSIATDKPSEKDSIIPADKSRSPSIASDKPSEKDSIIPADKSRSSSIASDKPEGKTLVDRSKSPSIAGDKHSEKDIAEVDDEEPVDRSKSSTIVTDKPSEKDSLIPAAKSRSHSIASDKPEEKTLIDRSKSPSIAGDKHSEKDITEVDDEEPVDRSKSPSIATDKSGEKDSIIPADKSRSPSIASDKPSEKDSIMPADKSRSPSIASDKPSEKDSIMPADKSRSPSIASDKPDEKTLIDRSKSPSIAGDKHSEQDVTEMDDEEPVDRSKSSSIADDKHSEKDTAKAFHDRSKSPSIAGDIHSGKDVFEKDEKSSVDRSRSSSIASQKPDEKTPIDRSKSPSICGDKSDKDLGEKDDKSRSPSIVTDKSDEKELIDRPKSPSIIGDKHSEKDFAEEDDKFSIASDKPDEKAPLDSSKSPSIAADKHSEDLPHEVVKSRSQSISGDNLDDKALIDRSKSPSIVDDKPSEEDRADVGEKSRSPSIIGDKFDGKPTIDRSRSPIIAGDKHSEKDVAEEDGHSRSPSIASGKHDETDLLDRSRSPSIAGDKPIETDLAKTRSPSITVEKLDGQAPIDLSKQSSEITEISSAPVDRSRSPSIVAKIDTEKSQKSSETQESSGDQKTVTAEIDEAKTERPTAAPPSSFIEEKIDSTIHERKSRSASIQSDIVESDGEKKNALDEHIEKIAKFTDVRKDSVSSVASVHDSKLDEKEAVQALQKLAETIADKSAETEQVAKTLLEESAPHETPKDRSRSHSLFDAGEKTPLGRSRAASLYEDKVPEVLSSHGETKAAFQAPGATYIYDESEETRDDGSRKSSLKDTPDSRKQSLTSESRKSSVAQSQDNQAKRDSMAIEEDIAGQFAKDYHTTRDEISKVEEYIVSRYIVKREKITLRVVEEMVRLYSMPKYMILELIEAIIAKKNVPRDRAVDYPEDDDICDSAVASRDDRVDAVDVTVAKRNDIESYIHDEFIAKNRVITSKTVDDMANLKGVVRYVIITIIEEIIAKRKIPRSVLVEDGVIDEQIAEVTSSGGLDSKRSSVASIASHGPIEHGDRFEEENLPSISADHKTASGPSFTGMPKESSIAEEKRVEVETYVMEECVKKGRKITVLVLEQIMTKMSISRTVLLDIIENIIVTRKMSRKTMVDDAIYDDIEAAASKSPEYRFEDITGKSTPELVPGRDRLAELSGISTPDPKSSGYSTPESRQYDDKYGKDMSYATDYESPFHKAFVGGMTEIRTTHITTLSGKSTPDFGPRGETPESLSESMTSSSQARTEEKVTLDKSHIADYEDTATTEPASSIATKLVTMTTTGTTLSSALSSTPGQKPEVSSVSAEHASEEGFPEDRSKMVKREIGGIETTAIGREIYEEEEEPEVIRTVIRREIIEDDDADEPEVITKVIRREIIEDEEPEVITKIIRREIVEQVEDSGDEYESPRIARTIGSRESSPEILETITTRTTKTIVTEDCPENIISEPISADVKRTITTVTTVTEPDGKVTTKKDVQESTDKLEGDELLERLMDSTKTEESGKLTDAKSIESLTTEKIITETIKTTTSGITGIRSDLDSGKSTPDLIAHGDKSDPIDRIHPEKIVVDKPEHPRSSIIKDLISDERSYSVKSSQDATSMRDAHLGGTSGKSTPDIPVTSAKETAGQSQMSGRSTPDRRPDSRSSTATPEGFRSSEVIRTTITTTREMSEEGDIITTTKEITETTNEKGETTVLAEKTDVKVEDRVPSKDIFESAFGSGFEDTKASSELPADKDFGPVSPRSDHSSLQSRAGTHAWESSEGRHTYSDDEVAGSPLSTTSQVGYSPQSTYHFGERSFGKDSSHKSMEFSEADMSSSFYGELPDLPPRVTTLKSAYLDSTASEASGTSDPAPIEGDFSFKKFTVEKESASGQADKSMGKKFIDDADLDFEKALMERKEMKMTGTVSGGPAKPASSSTSDESKDPKDDKDKDPLACWGSPLGLPSPKPPRKFNLRTTGRPTDSADISPDSLNFDAINDWGEPLRLPSPAPGADEASNKGAPSTPKKERKQPKKVITENLKNRKRSESPSKNEKKTKDSKNKVQPVYMDLTYVPHHGNSYYTSLEFFKRVRARYYVFSGTEPSREVYDALLDAKKTWEDKDLEVTMIPTYDTDTLGYWVADNEEALATNHIDLSPSASRCTINLQDHETSCSAYRLEF